MFKNQFVMKMDSHITNNLTQTQISSSLISSIHKSTLFGVDLLRFSRIGNQQNFQPLTNMPEKISKTKGGLEAKNYGIKSDGACLIRGCLAIINRDKTWLDERPLKEVYQWIDQNKSIFVNAIAQAVEHSVTILPDEENVIFLQRVQQCEAFAETYLEHIMERDTFSLYKVDVFQEFCEIYLDFVINTNFARLIVDSICHDITQALNVPTSPNSHAYIQLDAFHQREDDEQSEKLANLRNTAGVETDAKFNGMAEVTFDRDHYTLTASNDFFNIQDENANETQSKIIAQPTVNQLKQERHKPQAKLVPYRPDLRRFIVDPKDKETSFYRAILALVTDKVAYLSADYVDNATVINHLFGTRADGQKSTVQINFLAKLETALEKTFDLLDLSLKPIDFVEAANLFKQHLMQGVHSFSTIFAIFNQVYLTELSEAEIKEASERLTKELACELGFSFYQEAELGSSKQVRSEKAEYFVVDENGFISFVGIENHFPVDDGIEIAKVNNPLFTKQQAIAAAVELLSLASGNINQIASDNDFNTHPKTKPRVRNLDTTSMVIHENAQQCQREDQGKWEEKCFSKEDYEYQDAHSSFAEGDAADDITLAKKLEVEQSLHIENTKQILPARFFTKIEDEEVTIEDEDDEEYFLASEKPVAKSTQIQEPETEQEPTRSTFFFPGADAFPAFRPTGNMLTPEEYERQLEADSHRKNIEDYGIKITTDSDNEEIDEANIPKVRNKRRPRFKVGADQYFKFDVEKTPELGLTNAAFDNLKTILEKPLSDWGQHANPELARFNEITTEMTAMYNADPKMQDFFRNALDAYQATAVETVPEFRDTLTYHWSETDKSVHEKGEFFFHQDAENFFPRADNDPPFQSLAVRKEQRGAKVTKLFGQILNQHYQGKDINHRQLAMAMGNLNVDLASYKSTDLVPRHRDAIHGWFAPFSRDVETMRNYQIVASHLEAHSINTQVMHPIVVAQGTLSSRSGAEIGDGNLGVCLMFTEGFLLNTEEPGIGGWQASANYVNKVNELSLGDPVVSSRVYSKLNDMNSRIQGEKFYFPAAKTERSIKGFKSHHPSYDHMIDYIEKLPAGSRTKLSVQRKVAQSGHVVGITNLEISGVKVYVYFDSNLGSFPCFSTEQLKTIMEKTIKLIGKDSYDPSDPTHSQIKFATTALSQEYLDFVDNVVVDGTSMRDVATGDFTKLNKPIPMVEDSEWASIIPNAQPVSQNPIEAEIAVYKPADLDAERVESSYAYAWDKYRKKKLKTIEDPRIQTNDVEQAVQAAAAAKGQVQPHDANPSRIQIPDGYALYFSLPDTNGPPPPIGADQVMQLIHHSQLYDQNNPEYQTLQTFLTGEIEDSKTYFNDVLESFKELHNDSFDPDVVKAKYVDILDTLLKTFIEGSPEFRDAFNYFIYRTESEALLSGKKFRDTKLNGYFFDFDFQQTATTSAEFVDKMSALLTSIHIDATYQVWMDYEALGKAFAELQLNKLSLENNKFGAEQTALYHSWDADNVDNPKIGKMANAMTSGNFPDELAEPFLAARGITVDTRASSSTKGYGHLLAAAMVVEINKNGLQGLSNSHDLFKRFNELTITDPIASLRVTEGLENTVTELQKPRLTTELQTRMHHDILELAPRKTFTKFDDVITHAFSSDLAQCIVMKDSNGKLRSISVAKITFPGKTSRHKSVTIPVVVDSATGIFPCYTETQLTNTLRGITRLFLTSIDQLDTSIHGVYEYTPEILTHLENTNLKQSNSVNPFSELFTAPLNDFQEGAMITHDPRWANFFASLNQPETTALTSQTLGHRRPYSHSNFLMDRINIARSQVEEVSGTAAQFEQFLAKATATREKLIRNYYDPLGEEVFEDGNTLNQLFNQRGDKGNADPDVLDNGGTLNKLFNEGKDPKKPNSVDDVLGDGGLLNNLFREKTDKGNSGDDPLGNGEVLINLFKENKDKVNNDLGDDIFDDGAALSNLFSWNNKKEEQPVKNPFASNQDDNIKTSTSVDVEPSGKNAGQVLGELGVASEIVRNAEGNVEHVYRDLGDISISNPVKEDIILQKEASVNRQREKILDLYAQGQDEITGQFSEEVVRTGDMQGGTESTVLTNKRLIVELDPHATTQDPEALGKAILFGLKEDGKMGDGTLTERVVVSTTQEDVLKPVVPDEPSITVETETIDVPHKASTDEFATGSFDQKKVINQVLDQLPEEHVNRLFDQETLAKLRSGKIEIIPEAVMQEVHTQNIKIQRLMQETSAHLTEQLNLKKIDVGDVELVGQISSRDETIRFKRKSTGHIVEVDVSSHAEYKAKLSQLEMHLEERVKAFNNVIPAYEGQGFNPFAVVWDLYGKGIRVAGMLMSVYSFCTLLQQSLNLGSMDPTARVMFGLSLVDVAVDNIANAVSIADWMISTISTPLQGLSTVSNVMGQASLGISLIISIVQIGLLAYSLEHAETELDRKLGELFLEFAILRTTLMGATIAVTAFFPPAAPLMATLGFLLAALQNHEQGIIISEHIANQYYEGFEKEMKEVSRLLNEPNVAIEFKDNSVIFISNKMPYTKLIVKEDKIEMIKDGKAFGNKFFRSVMKRGEKYKFRLFKEPSSRVGGNTDYNNQAGNEDLKDYTVALSEISEYFQLGYGQSENYFDLNKITGSGYKLAESLKELGWIKKENDQYYSDIYFDIEQREATTMAECLDNKPNQPITALVPKDNKHKNIVVPGHPVRVRYVTKSCKKVSWNGYEAQPNKHETVQRLNWCGTSNRPNYKGNSLTAGEIVREIASAVILPLAIYDMVKANTKEPESEDEYVLNVTNDPEDFPDKKDQYWRVRQHADTFLRVDADSENNIADRNRYKGKLFAVDLGVRSSAPFANRVRLSLDTAKHCYDIPEEVELEFLAPEYELSSGGDVSHVYHFPRDALVENLKNKQQGEHLNYGFANGYPIVGDNSIDSALAFYKIKMNPNGEHNFYLYPGTMLWFSEKEIEGEEKKGNIHLIVSFDLFNENLDEHITEYNTKDDNLHHIVIQLDKEKENDINLFLDETVGRPIEIALNTEFTKDNGINSTLTTGIQLLPNDLYKPTTTEPPVSTTEGSSTSPTDLPPKPVIHQLNYITNVPYLSALEVTERVVNNAHRIFPDLQTNVVRLANLDLEGSKYHDEQIIDNGFAHNNVKNYLNISLLEGLKKEVLAMKPAQTEHGNSVWNDFAKLHLINEIRGALFHYAYYDFVQMLPDTDNESEYSHFSAEQLEVIIIQWMKNKLRKEGCAESVPTFKGFIEKIKQRATAGSYITTLNIFDVFKQAFIKVLSVEDETKEQFKQFAKTIIGKTKEQGHYPITNENDWHDKDKRQSILLAFISACSKNKQIASLGQYIQSKINNLLSQAAYSANAFVEDIANWIKNLIDVKSLGDAKSTIQTFYDSMQNDTVTDIDPLEGFLRANGLKLLKRGILKGIYEARDLSLGTYLTNEENAINVYARFFHNERGFTLSPDAKWQANAIVIPADKENPEGEKRIIPTIWRSKHKSLFCPFEETLNRLVFIHSEKVSYEQVPEELRKAFKKSEEVELYYFIDQQSKVLALQYGNSEIRWWQSSDFMWGGTNKIFKLGEIGGVNIDRLVCDSTLGKILPRENPYSQNQLIVSGYLAPIKAIYTANNMLGKMPLFSFIKEYINRALQSQSSKQGAPVNNLLLILDNESFSNQGVSFSEQKPHQVILSYYEESGDNALAAVLYKDEDLLFVDHKNSKIYFKKHSELDSPLRQKVLRVFTRKMKPKLFSEEVTNFRSYCKDRAYSSSIYAGHTIEFELPYEIQGLFYDTNIEKFVAHVPGDVVASLDTNFEPAGLLQVGDGYVEFNGVPDQGDTTTEKVINDYSALSHKYGSSLPPIMFYIEGEAFSYDDPTVSGVNIFIEKDSELPFYIPTQVDYGSGSFATSKNIGVSYTIINEKSNKKTPILQDPISKLLFTVEDYYESSAKAMVFFRYGFMQPVGEVLYLGLKDEELGTSAEFPYLGIDNIIILPSENLNANLALPKLNISLQAQNHLKKITLSAPDTATGKVQPIKINNEKVGLDGVKAIVYRDGKNFQYLTLSVPGADIIDGERVEPNTMVFFLDKALDRHGKIRAIYDNTFEINDQVLTLADLERLVVEGVVIDTQGSPNQLFLVDNSERTEKNKGQMIGFYNKEGDKKITNRLKSASAQSAPNFNGKCHIKQPFAINEDTTVFSFPAYSDGTLYGGGEEKVRKGSGAVLFKQQTDGKIQISQLDKNQIPVGFEMPCEADTEKEKEDGTISHIEELDQREILTKLRW